MGALKEPYTWSLPAETEPQSRHYNRGKLNVGCGVGASEVARGAMFEPFFRKGIYHTGAASFGGQPLFLAD